MIKRYQPSNPQTWKGRGDGQRLHQMIQCVNIQEGIPATDFGFLGFACDEGVKRNNGRPGAVEGPNAMRKALANLPLKKFKYTDFGDVTCHDGNLEESQTKLADTIGQLLSKGIKPIVMGGGHEVAWGHYRAIVKAFPEASCSIVNFDAHFDLRPLIDGTKGSSGTPFLQIANLCKENNKPFQYACLGIQSFGNSETLFTTAQELNVKVVTADEFHLDGISKGMKVVDQMIDQSEMIYLTICLDAFSSSSAPGVSAPQPLGLTPWHVIPALRRLAASGKVISIDIAELSPPFDQDNHTAQLAASLIGNFIFTQT